MSEASDTIETHRAAAALRAAFSQHGYGFQYSVANELYRLFAKRQSAWKLEAVEQPVGHGDNATHIDIVLRSGTGAIAVVECKRANPALAAWCFAKSGLASERADYVAFEGVFRPPTVQSPQAFRKQDEYAQWQYHVGLEVRTDAKGDTHGNARGALSEAVKQSLRSGAGIVREMYDRPSLLGQRNRVVVVPMIVTTAELVVCDTDLSAAALSSGELPAGLEVKSRKWLWLRSTVSANIRHGLTFYRKENPVFTEFGEVQDADYARSIGIVTWDGLQEFLKMAQLYSER